MRWNRFQCAGARALNPQRSGTHTPMRVASGSSLGLLGTLRLLAPCRRRARPWAGQQRDAESCNGLPFDVTSHSTDISATETAVQTSSISSRMLGALCVTAVVIAAYVSVVRPSQLRWGATDAELARGMPGDALSSRPTFLSTRAVTIDASPEAIWPWVLQMGYGRAGFYGYDVIENIGSARGMHSAEHIVPELQRIKVGDPLPLSAAGGLVVHAITPNRFIVWSGASGTYPGAFTWALYPVDSNHTRLVSRIQWSHHWTQPLVLAMDLFTEFADHVAVRKVLRGVKDRAEGRVEPFGRQTVEFTLLVWAFVAFPTAIWCVLRHPVTVRGCFVGLAAGLVWLVVWYAPTDLGVGVALNVLVVWLLRWTGRERHGVGSTHAPSSHAPSTVPIAS